MQETILETMLARRSVRAYTDQPVPEAALAKILKCALYAPNGGGLQMARFLVLRRPENMARLNTTVQRELAAKPIVEGHMMKKGILRARTPGYRFAHGAPVLITAVAPRSYSNAMADCACALENVQLAATALGLGSCWSNQPYWLTDSPELRALFEELGLLPDEDIYGSVALGYAAAEPKAAARRTGRIAADEGLYTLLEEEGVLP